MLPAICSTGGGRYEVTAPEGILKGEWSVNLSVISAAENSLVLSAGSAWLSGGDPRSLALALDRAGRPLRAQVGPSGSMIEMAIHRERAAFIQLPSAEAAETRMLTTPTSFKGFKSLLIEDAVVLGVSIDEGRVHAVAFAHPGRRPKIISEGIISWDSAEIEAVLGCDAALCSSGLHPVSLDVFPAKPDLGTSPPDRTSTTSGLRRTCRKWGFVPCGDPNPVPCWVASPDRSLY